MEECPEAYHQADQQQKQHQLGFSYLTLPAREGEDKKDQDSWGMRGSALAHRDYDEEEIKEGDSRGTRHSATTTATSRVRSRNIPQVSTRVTPVKGADAAQMSRKHVRTVCVCSLAISVHH